MGKKIKNLILISKTHKLFSGGSNVVDHVSHTMTLIQALDEPSIIYVGEGVHTSMLTATWWWWKGSHHKREEVVVEDEAPCVEAEPHDHVLDVDYLDGDGDEVGGGTTAYRRW